MTVQASLCRTCSKTTLLVFPRGGSCRKFCIFFSSENTSICEGLGHCKLTQDTYPTCVWKRDDEYNSSEVSYFFPTPTPKPPPTPPQAVTTTAKTGKLVAQPDPQEQPMWLRRTNTIRKSCHGKYNPFNPTYM